MMDPDPIDLELDEELRDFGRDYACAEAAAGAMNHAALDDIRREVNLPAHLPANANIQAKVGATGKTLTLVAGVVLGVGVLLLALFGAPTRPGSSDATDPTRNAELQSPPSAEQSAPWVGPPLVLSPAPSRTRTTSTEPQEATPSTQTASEFPPRASEPRAAKSRGAVRRPAFSRNATAPPPRAEKTVSRAPSESASSLTTELGLLEEARVQLGKGHAHECIQLLEQHQRDFPRSRFVREREGTRITALCLQGEEGLAQRKARAYVKRFGPSSTILNANAPCDEVPD